MTYVISNTDGTESFEVEAEDEGQAAIEVLGRRGWFVGGEDEEE